MPKAVHDLATKLQSQGKSEDSAWAIANSAVGKTTKNDKNMEELMDQSPSMTNVAPSPQNTAGWPTSQNPSLVNTPSQMTECDICGMPAHPPNDHPFLPRMPNDPMAMTQQPQMPMAPLPMQPPIQPPMQPPQQPPMQPHPAEEGGMGSGQYPHGGGGQMGAPSGGGQSGGGSGGGGEGGFGSPGMGGGQRPQPGPVVSFETVSETIMKQLIDTKVGCGCQKSKKG